jgi:hypothetical protein
MLEGNTPAAPSAGEDAAHVGAVRCHANVWATATHRVHYHSPDGSSLPNSCCRSCSHLGPWSLVLTAWWSARRLMDDPGRQSHVALLTALPVWPFCASLQARVVRSPSCRNHPRVAVIGAREAGDPARHVPGAVQLGWSQAGGCGCRRARCAFKLGAAVNNARSRCRHARASSHVVIHRPYKRQSDESQLYIAICV